VKNKKMSDSSCQTINRLQEFVGKRVILIGMDHNSPQLKVTLGTLERYYENGFLSLKDTIHLNPFASMWIKASPTENWTGEGYPIDGYAKTFTVIDKETEEIIFNVPWDQLRMDLYFSRKHKFYGKPWSEIPIIDKTLYNFDSLEEKE